MSQAQADAIRRIREWRANPVKFVWDNFGVEPDAWQREVLEVFPDPDPAKRRIALQACAGPGKSAVLTWCGWNFLSCYGAIGEHPKAAAVSITTDNLKDNLWAEFSKWQQRSPYLSRAFEWTKQKIFAKDHPETWFISARSFPKTANVDEMGRTLSGLHSQFVLYLIDESGGIHPAVLRAAEQGLSNCSFGKILQAGNPFTHDGMLYAAATTLRSQWHMISITGDPDDPRRSPRIDIEWARQQIQTYGRENPWVMAYILGKFPPSSINALISPDECAIAAARHFREDQYSWAPKVLGVDCARFGDDTTVLFPRQGLASFTPTVLRNAKTQDIGGRIIRAHREPGWDACFIDTAMASGVIDYCEQLEYHLTPVDFGGAARDPVMYANRRAEMAKTATDFLRAGGGIPNDPELIAELCAHTYTFDNRGRILLEPKEQVKVKLGRSPDKFDGYILTHADQVAVPIKDELGRPILEEIGHAVIDDGRYG